MATLDVGAPKGNIQQRVFDAFPAYPVPISIVGLYAALPGLDKNSLRNAVSNLKALGLVELVTGSKFTYQRAKDAARPPERRGGVRTHGSRANQ